MDDPKIERYKRLNGIVRNHLQEVTEELYSMYNDLAKDLNETEQKTLEEIILNNNYELQEKIKNCLW